MRPSFQALVCGLAATVAFAAGVAGATSESKPSAKSPTAAQPVSKAQRCAELKKKIADYEAASKRGGKPAGAETIKQDIDWYKKNC